MMSAATSAHRDMLSPLRLKLRANGYPPVPVAGPKMRCKSPGKQPLMRDWRAICADADEAEIRRWAVTEPGCTNTGILADGLAGADIDIPVPILAAQVEALAAAKLGGTALRRIGRAPKSLLLYRTATPLPKMETPELLLPDGTKVQVEILGAGQQFVAYGVHPDTGADYEWPEAGPDVVPLSDLPEVTEIALRGFLTSAEALLRAAGGLTQKEREKAEKAASGGAEEPERGTTTSSSTSSSSGRRSGAGGDTFFKQVNQAALDGLDAWVPKLFPRAQRQATGAYRVSSADLGRAFEEDLSVHPAGVQDFGPRRGLSPCDVLMEFGGAPSVQEAAFKLCEFLGRAPTDFGWKDASKPKKAKPSANPRDLDGFDLTEDGVALAFLRRFKDHLRYCHHTGAWYQWNDSIWRREETKLAFSWARLVCREIAREADTDGKLRATLARAATAAAVERFAQSDRAFAVTSEIWDRDQWLLGTPGGTVDLRTGERQPAKQGDYITKATAVAPAPQMQCQTWLAFLREATAGDKALMRFLQQWCGYCLTGITREHALLFIYGPGGNGKSVFLNTVAAVLGDYCRTASMDTFTASPGDRHSTDIAMLRGARLVTATETEEGRAWAEARIKQMTGGDPVTARFMRQDFFTFTPQFKLTIAGNHKPALRNVDDGARRRFNIVPFLHKPTQPDRQLEEKLRAEWPGILGWIIDGCLDWQNNGLVRPKVVVEATEEYFAAQDTIGRWLAERCILEPHLEEKPGRLVADCRTWAANNGEAPPTPPQFRGALERTNGIRYAMIRGIQHAKGIGLRPEPGAGRAWGEEG